ncbi:MBL fold metallo-hydrolase [Pseudonocardia sp. DSM 110487]|uniref:MBL fold metallo-hydrolase n=1 Tax=Pseudonocardia sp. DSM 110487 TaxID=2865833 RepID=UPI001C6A7C61|nr:MBL fold metallo-hydrolase [Pseudonocardia sp. DSM 110487]QYN33535.1 MBL fold metallo-hydrolase [Pseudonocardia sp. DSM 110487]
MCDAIGAAVNSLPRADRRSFLRILGATAAAGGIAAAAGCSTTAGGASPSAAAAPGTTLATIGDPGARTRLVLLGTSGGPLMTSAERVGTSTAIVVGDRYYLVDVGWGSNLRLVQAGLGSSPQDGVYPLAKLAGIFLTHLHSDHIAEWPSLYLTGVANARGRELPPIQVFGPGDRAVPPSVFPPNRPTPELVFPERPGPGIAGMTEQLRRAFAADLNDRIRDQGLADPRSLFEVHDIDLTGIADVDPEGVPPRLTTPIPVWEDDDVRVTATLVDHRPTAPAFGYRFDTPDGSIVISGDTTVSDNLIDLAQDCDYLVHEVIDAAWIESFTSALPPEAGLPLRQHLYASHTTVEQVGRDVAERAGAKNLVLNHLTAGTTDEAWQKAQNGYSGNLVIGRDLLQMAVASS